MSIARHHAEWLSLLDISDPFLSLKVLTGTLAQGLDAPDADVARELRLAYEEWLNCHERYAAEEVRQGLHGKEAKKATAKGNCGKQAAESVEQGELF
jgi:hypothetical protein